MEALIFALHIIFASLWIGGMLFMVLVLSPYVRKLPPTISTEAYQEVGKRYSLWGTFIGLPLLLLTGLYNMHLMGVDLSELLHGSSQYISTLRLKIGFYLITVILAFSHDLYFGPKSAENPKLKRFARIFGVINLVVGLIIIYLAVRLRLGG